VSLRDFDAADFANDGDADLAGVLEAVFDFGGEVRIGRCYRHAAPFELQLGFVAQTASRLPVYRCAFPLTLHFVFRRRDRMAMNRDPWRHITMLSLAVIRAAEKQKRNVMSCML
jgi:hypothetical protein